MRLIVATSLVALAGLTSAVPRSVQQRSGVPIPISKRSGLVNQDMSINVELLMAHVESATAKVARGFKNYRKNTRDVDPVSQKRGAGPIPLTNDKSTLWYGSVSVGSPPNTFTVNFDTGSSDFFLPGPQCTSSNCTGHTIYDPSASSTAYDMGQTFDISYGDGSSVSGELFGDDVTIAGLTATGQTLGVASSYSSGLATSNFPPDGLMGLAFQTISAYNASSVFETLVNQGQTDQPAFSFKLAASGSELYIGGANSALYTGKFTYTPVTTAGYWEVNMDSVDSGGQTILSNINSIIDSGTSLIIGDPSSVATLYQALGGTDASSTVGSGYYTFPCNSFPSVSFTFGGTQFAISANTLNIGPVSSGSSDCVSGIVGQNTGDSYWIVGDVFLQNVYSTFDMGNQQVGFATLA